MSLKVWDKIGFLQSIIPRLCLQLRHICCWHQNASQRHHKRPLVITLGIKAQIRFCLWENAATGKQKTILAWLYSSSGGLWWLFYNATHVWTLISCPRCMTNQLYPTTWEVCHAINTKDRLELDAPFHTTLQTVCNTPINEKNHAL